MPINPIRGAEHRPNKIRKYWATLWEKIRLRVRKTEKNPAQKPSDPKQDQTQKATEQGKGKHLDTDA